MDAEMMLESAAAASAVASAISLSASNRRKRKQQQPIKLPNSSAELQLTSPSGSPPPPPPSRPPPIPLTLPSSLRTLPPPPPPLLDGSGDGSAQLLTSVAPAQSSTPPPLARGGRSSSSAMLIDFVDEYEADPARRNKRGHRGIGKVQPKQLDNGLEAFPCPACDKEGVELLLHSREELTSHLRTHNKPTDVSGGHICAICGRELSSQSSLDRHMLTHSDERPFGCPLCPTSFTTNGNMRRHLSTHKSDPNLMDEVTRHLNTDKRRKRHRAMEAAAAAAAVAATASVDVGATPDGAVVGGSSGTNGRGPKPTAQTTTPAKAAAVSKAASSMTPRLPQSGAADSFGNGRRPPAPQVPAAAELYGWISKTAAAAAAASSPVFQTPSSTSTLPTLPPPPMPSAAALLPLRPHQQLPSAVADADDTRSATDSAKTTQAVARVSANRKRASGGGGGVNGGASGGVVGSGLPHPGAYFNRLSSLRAARRLRRRYLLTHHHHHHHQHPATAPSAGRKRVSQSSMGQNREGKRGRRESSVMHQCDQCGRRCFGKKNLVIHKATSHGSPPQKTIYCCLGRLQDGSPCGEKDEDLATMKRHVMINHIKIDPYICKLCNPGAVLSVGLGDKQLHKQHGSFCTRENAHRHLLQQRSHECIADMRRSLDPSQWRLFAAQVKKELCGVVRVSDDLKQRLIGDENSSCNVCQLELGSPEALRSHFEARPSCEARFACPHCSHDLLGPEQLLEHASTKHKDCKDVEPRACLTKKLVWLKRPRQRPAKVVDDQPLDLSATSAATTVKEETSLIDDSGCPPTPAKDAVLLNPFLHAWATPALWSGLFSWPYRYPPHLLPPTPAFPGHPLGAAGVPLPGDTAAAATSTPTAAVPATADADGDFAVESQRRPQRRAEETPESAGAPILGSGSSGGSGGGGGGANSGNSDSEGDAGPMKKKAKKNSYKDAPNLIFCPFNNCKQSFPWMSSLKRHIITHTSHKPYCCTRCSQSFSTKSNRERHMERIHHIKVKGNHAFLSSEELTTFFEHDKVAEKIGEELLNQLGNNVVTSVNPHRLMAHRADGEPGQDPDKDSGLSASPGGCSGHQSSSAASASATSIAAAATGATTDVVGLAGAVFKCPECPFASASRREALEHLSRDHGDVWQLVATRSRLATVDAVMAGGAAAPCSEDEEADADCPDDDPETGEDDRDDIVVTSDVDNIPATDEDDDDDGSRSSTTPGGGARRRLLCPVCSARLWSPRHLRQHMRGHTGAKPHRCPLCERTFRLSHSLRRHLRSRHPRQQAASCETAASTELLFQPWRQPQDSPINLRVVDAAATVAEAATAMAPADAES